MPWSKLGSFRLLPRGRTALLISFLDKSLFLDNSFTSLLNFLLNLPQIKYLNLNNPFEKHVLSLIPNEQALLFPPRLRDNGFSPWQRRYLLCLQSVIPCGWPSLRHESARPTEAGEGALVIASGERDSDPRLDEMRAYNRVVSPFQR